MNATDLEVSVQAFDAEMQVLMGFTWNITSFAGDRMLMLLDFENPAQISTDILGKDKLRIKVLNPSKFLSEAYRTSVKNETELEKNIPKQLAIAQEAQVLKLEAQAEEVAQSSTALMGSSFAINILLASSLSLLWGLVNSLQIVAFFMLLNIQFPMNATIWYRTTYEMANLDLIPTEDIGNMI